MNESANEHHLLVVDTLDQAQNGNEALAAALGQLSGQTDLMWDLNNIATSTTPKCQDQIMRPEHYKAAPTILRNAFPTRGAKKQQISQQTKALLKAKLKSPNKPKTAASPQIATGVASESPMDGKECSLY